MDFLVRIFLTSGAQMKVVTESTQTDILCPFIMEAIGHVCWRSDNFSPIPSVQEGTLSKMIVPLKTSHTTTDNTG